MVLNLFRRGTTRTRTKSIGRNVSSLIQERKEKEKLARAYARQAAEESRIEKARRTSLRYNRTGRVNTIGTSVFSSFARGRRQQLVYGRDVRRPLIGSGIKTGKKGRPKGSYDPRYAQYGGVYGYRKLLNASLRQQRIQQAQQGELNPQQRELLNRFAAQQNIVQNAPENRPIPDTTGRFNLRSLNQEIDEAANLVD